MNHAAPSIETGERDLIDRIAEALPVEVRADYYRELRHCRSLPENDEMLRILRAMQFLTLLIEQAPTRLASERGKLDHCLTECVTALQKIHERLDRLPSEVASGISPQAIAANINESLRQQFLQSTIPQTGEALAVVGAQIKRAVADFQQTAAKISSAHQSAASDADRAVRNIDSAISCASESARKATVVLTNTYIHEYRWSVSVLVVVAVIAGMILGVTFDNWRLSPVPPVPQTSVMVPKTKR